MFQTRLVLTVPACFILRQSPKRTAMMATFMNMPSQSVAWIASVGTSAAQFDALLVTISVNIFAVDKKLMSCGELNNSSNSTNSIENNSNNS